MFIRCTWRWGSCTYFLWRTLWWLYCSFPSTCNSFNITSPHPPTFPAAGRKKNTFRKTIVLVSLTSTSADKPSSSKSPGLNYTVVTQVVVTLEANNCSSGVVADLVKQQVGYEVILLNSNCFPVLDTETTRSIEYWKSTRKILAASLSLYTRLKGTSADPEWARVEVDLTNELEENPRPKRAYYSQQCSPGSKLEQISDKLDQAMGKLDRIELIDTKLGKLENQIAFAASLTDVFECVICKTLSNRPVTASCCCRIVGCEECVQQWVYANNTCPLCSSEATTQLFSELKGFEQALLVASQLVKLPDSRGSASGHEANSPSPIHPYHVSTPPHYGSDEDFEN